MNIFSLIVNWFFNLIGQQKGKNDTLTKLRITTLEEDVQAYKNAIVELSNEKNIEIDHTENKNVINESPNGDKIIDDPIVISTLNRLRSRQNNN